MRQLYRSLWLLAFGFVSICNAYAQVLDKQQQLDRQDFWDNRDWDWYIENIPFFECPDEVINTTYYYRWELMTKHLTYGSPSSGYSFTEFIDRPFWSGAYGAISCPAGHQLYEARWLRSPRVSEDYLKYWLRTPGSQPRNYSTWLADSAWAMHQVHPNKPMLIDLLPDLIRHYEGWEQRHFVPEVGLFWQTGHDDGMEFNINSRQTKDILRGAPSYRPSFNAYMWADAKAIAKIAVLAGQPDLAEKYDAKAASLKSKVQELLWDEKRQFFFPAFRDNEEREGHQIKALSRTYETGQFAGDPHGRELIGYVPWAFQMLDTDKGFEVSWNKLMNRDGFFADFGPSTVERNDPMFLLQKSCCWWSGQSWPFATTQTLKAMAGAIRGADQNALLIDRADYLKMLQIFAASHRKEGRPYLAEALHPDTGSFEGHDAYNHSEHYFHSGFCDLVITGLVGIVEQPEDSLIVDPLAPVDWDYFALDDVVYHDHRLSIVWDRKGDRYNFGPGLHVLRDGKVIQSSPDLRKLNVAWPSKTNQSNLKSTTGNLRESQALGVGPMNFAVNNDGDYYPRMTASFVSVGSSLSKINDGNYWYHIHPPNRWTTSGSTNQSDWVEIEFGMRRPIDTVKLYFLEDDSEIRVPKDYQLEYWDGSNWKQLPEDSRQPTKPTGHRANTVRFASREIEKLRVKLVHDGELRSGLTELEAWGVGALPYSPAPPPAGNVAFNQTGQGYPKATASYTDRFGGNPKHAIDGKIIFIPTPMNRWTSYESPESSDWFELDFGAPKSFDRVDLHIYDDRGGVQPPLSYEVQVFRDDIWQAVQEPSYSPEKPIGSQINSVRFKSETAARLRIVFQHNSNSRSGATELEVWSNTDK